MDTMAWVQTIFYFVLLPIILGMITRFADLPEVSDIIEFPTDRDVLSALNTASDVGRIDGDCMDYAAQYIRQYILFSEEQDLYRKKQMSELFFPFAALLTLIICCFSWVKKIQCPLFWKIVFSCVALALFAFFLMFLQWKKYPNYESSDYTKKKEYKLPSLYKATKTDVYDYFWKLHNNYQSVISWQREAMRDNVGRSKILRFVLVCILFVSAYIYLPH